LKEKLKEILIRSARKWAPLPPFEVERPNIRAHGELSTNLVLVLAKSLKKNPRDLAQEIKDLIPPEDREGIVEKIEVAGGGFLNFVLRKSAWQEALREVEGDRFGTSREGEGKKALVELVSANPTGPLHIGNARGGPLGDVIASLLEATGYEVTREYYVNDVGGQIDKLGESLLERIEKGVSTGEYKGEYIDRLAEKAMDEKIDKTAQALGRFGVAQMTEEMKRDCENMGIRFNSWIHEKELLESGKTAQVLAALKKKKVTVEKEGALWLSSEEEFLKDRESVLVRTDGRPTYFANDIAYHVDKLERGFDRILNIWGSNHHGHIPRLRAALKGLGDDPARIETVLYQFVRVKRGSEIVKMSKRGGTFITAREVLDEVGRDAFRFFLLMRTPASHLDFDLDLARRQSQENPVYYVQYAYARLCAIERKAAEMNLPPFSKEANLERLELPEEIDLIQRVLEYPEEIRLAAARLEPQRIPFYLLELTKLFQSYYTKAKEDPCYRVLGLDVDTSQAKRYLCAALKLTLSQGLKLLGISAPEVMEQTEKE